MEQLQDKFGRTIDYLRLSVTDRCNLRCTYCMPERGLKFSPKEHLLTYEELLYLVDILGSLGISKIRITGGEPFVRADLMAFLKSLAEKDFLKKINITSNITLIRPYLDELEELGIKDINVSLDSLEKENFQLITRRDEFEEVERALYEMIGRGFNLKINCVVIKGLNEQQILPLLGLAETHPVSVRFLEEMPFNGSGVQKSDVMNYREILSQIEQKFAFTKLIDEPSSTSMNYRIEGFKGSFGVIPSYSRTFCGTCNRLRLSSTGEVRTCLYGKEGLNLKEMLRGGATEASIKEALILAVQNKPVDGFAAAEENEHSYSSMTTLGG